MFEEFDNLFHSPTIKPSFEKVHAILALFIFEENEDGIGRYRLQKELLIGSGTARSLIKRLNKNVNFITVLDDDNINKGHALTQNGINFLKKIKKRIPLIIVGEPSELEDIIIKSKGYNPYFCLVRDSSDKLTNGIEQRDAAIKIGGIGATCLIFDGINLIFPSQISSENQEEQMKVENKTFNYINNLFNIQNTSLKENDVVIIGLGENLEKSRLAALNAALTLL